MNRTIRTVALVEPAVEAEFYLTALFAQMRCQYPLLQAELRAHGYRPRIFAETLGAFDEHTLGEIAGHDVIAVSDTVTTHRRTAELLAELRRRNPEAVVVLGGILVKFFADLALEHADYLVNGDGEGVFVGLLQALGRGQDQPDLPGVGYRGGPIPGYHCAERTFASDFDDIPGYGQVSARRSVFGFRKVVRHSLFATRGCINECSFCPCHSPFRKRPVEYVLQDLRALLRRFPDTVVPLQIMLVDDCPYGDPDYLSDLLERIAFAVRDRNVLLEAQVRSTVLADPAVARRFARAKFNVLAIGFETVNERSLLAQRKGAGVTDGLAAIEACRGAGITPYGYFIAGFPTDDLGTVEQIADFVLRHRLIGQLLPYHVFDRDPVAGTFRVDPSTRVLDPFAFGGTVFVSNAQPAFKPSELQRALLAAYRRIFSAKRLPWLCTTTERLYVLTYRSILKVWEPSLRRHLEFLEHWEHENAHLWTR